MGFPITPSLLYFACIGNYDFHLYAALLACRKDHSIEVVSRDDPQRDLVTKRNEYAQAGIPEYWIVDPQTETITVLRLDDARYVEHGVFGRGEVATSAHYAGLQAPVGDVLDAP